MALPGKVSLVVASTNPVKIAAARLAFQRCFPHLRPHLDVLSIDVASGVRDQPIGDEETLRGARNRVQNAVRALPPEMIVHDHAAPTIVAVEGGVGRRPHDGRTECFAWVVAARPGAESEARSASFVLPDPLVALMEGEGLELGAADDKLFGRTKSGKGSGTVGHLTQDLVTREAYYEQAVIMALIPFMNAKYYGSQFEMPSIGGSQES